jgi:DNA-binding response OmpR family regulator
VRRTGYSVKKKILLISEDPNLIRNSLSWVLRDDLTEVQCAMDGYEAFRELRNRSFDLCFLDIHLPDLNSLDLMWTIKRLYPATRIIVMTGSSVDSDTMNAIWDYAVLRLVKPFDLYSAKALANEIIEKHIDGYQDYDALVRQMVAEKRLHERKLVVPPVNYTVLIGEDERDHQRHFADAVDHARESLERLPGGHSIHMTPMTGRWDPAGPIHRSWGSAVTPLAPVPASSPGIATRHS